MFFNDHFKPHIDYASVVWDGCSNVLKNRLNSLHRRAVKLISPVATLTTDQKLKLMTMTPHKQLEYKKGTFIYMVFNNEALDYISNLYTHTHTHTHTRLKQQQQQQQQNNKTKKR